MLENKALMRARAATKVNCLETIALSNLKIRNVIASFRLHQPPDLSKLLRVFRNECFFQTINNPNYGFKVVAVKLARPKVTLLIYSTGSVVVVGGRSLDAPQSSYEILRRRLSKEDIDIGENVNVKIQNIVATSDVGSYIDIENFARKSGGGLRTIYEPEQFPGVIVWFTVNSSTATILLFSSGKLVCLGLKTLREIKAAIRRLLVDLRKSDSLRSRRANYEQHG
jgi:transcription initiation factor TFIID TATA-box-binding protein